MSPPARKCLVCSCDDTMPLDSAALARGLGAAPEMARQLCRSEVGRIRAAVAEGLPLTIGCTQEAALFEEIAADAGRPDLIATANLRETGGWSAQARDAGAKMAALLAVAAEPVEPIALTTLDSGGIVLVLGKDETAVAAGTRLADHLDVTVLVAPGSDIAPPRRTTFPVLQGRARKAQGHLGAFEVTVDAYALPAPSSRMRLTFGPPRDATVSRCDLILDLTGDAPAFTAPDLRDGYLRADPRDAAAVERAIFSAAQLVGTFDRPRYISFDAGLCAHSRSGIVGCTRCLDLCPASAIKPDGDSVAIDPNVCAGCGQCAAACPTGAASYALPTASALVGRLRALLRTYAAAGGQHAVVLLHDTDHGEALIDASARFGNGLPARVLPLAVNEITQVGPEALASAIAYGATAVRLLGRARPRHDISGLHRTLAMTGSIFAGLGYGDDAVRLIETDDPETLEHALATLPPGPARPAPAGFLPPGPKRALLEVALRELHRVAPEPCDVVPLPAGAPFGAAVIDSSACTLCLACVSACPTAALTDSPDAPMLRFTESLCVQCGLCAATCPETAITLEPRLDFPAWETPRRILKEEAPLACVSCGKPFGVASTVARVRERLAGHWMYAGELGEARLRVLEMCQNCRIEAVVNESFDPHDARARTIRTTADYLRERDGKAE